MTAALAAQARSFGAGIAASPGVVGAELEGETMFARYRYRAYPTPDQQNMLARTFGCARVVFNDALRTRDEAYTAGEKISDTEVQRQVITLAKTTPEREWLTEVASVALVQACQDARRAYRNWFDSLSGKRKGRKVGHPRFRSRKDNRQSIRFARNGFGVTAKGVRVAKVGNVRLEWSQDLPSVPSSVTVIREADGRYYASFVVEVQDTPLPVITTDVGVDLGLTSLAVLSTGEVIGNPRYLRRKARALARAAAVAGAKGKGIQQPEEGGQAGCCPAPQGPGDPPGRTPQTGSETDPRQPSGLRRRPRGIRPGENQAGEVRA